MDKKEQIKKNAPSQVSLNARGSQIKPDIYDNVNIYEQIFNLKLTSSQKLFLLLLASEANYSIKLSFNTLKDNKIPKHKYHHLVFSKELEYKLMLSSKHIKKMINQLIKLNYITKSTSDCEEYNAYWYQLSGKSFKIFYNEGFL